MWVVRNRLRGTLTFRGLGISIPPKGEFDLDALGRDRAATSNQIQVAFEEGYLETVSRDAAVPANGGSQGAGIGAAALDERLTQFREQLRDQLREDLASLRTSVVGDVRDALLSFKSAKLKLTDEKRRVLEDDTLSAAEIRARLALLEEQERELTTNFSSIGRKDDIASDHVEAKADLLSSI